MNQSAELGPFRNVPRECGHQAFSGLLEMPFRAWNVQEYRCGMPEFSAVQRPTVLLPSVGWRGSGQAGFKVVRHLTAVLELSENSTHVAPLNVGEGRRGAPRSAAQCPYPSEVHGQNGHTGKTLCPVNPVEEAVGGLWASFDTVSRPQRPASAKPAARQCLCARRRAYLRPTTAQRYNSPVAVRVISPAAAAARTSLSDSSWRGVCPGLKVICTSSHSGLKPSP